MGIMKKIIPYWRQGRTRHFFSFGAMGALFALIFFVGAPLAFAGFGITPPYVNNQRLARGSTFQQVINLVRSDPVDDLNVSVSVNVPGADAWFTVDKGTSFTIPKGVTQMPMVVTVHVPSDAAFNDYRGAIRIRTSSASASNTGAVSIALGAQADVDIKVVDKIFDFTIHQVRVSDLEEGRTQWGLFFPGKIRFFMVTENTGNTTFGPTKVHFDIYDANDEKLLESTDNTNNIEKIPSFATKEVVAELPTRLPKGTYIAKFTIYKNADIAQQGQLSLSIGALGSVPGYEGYGFDGLSLSDKLKVAAVFAVPILIILFLVYLWRRRRRRKKKMNEYTSR